MAETGDAFVDAATLRVLAEARARIARAARDLDAARVMLLAAGAVEPGDEMVRTLEGFRDGCREMAARTS